MEKKTGGPFYKSTRELKWLAAIIFCLGVIAGSMIVVHAWPNTLENLVWYGFNMTIGVLTMMASLVMSLLLCVFADMLDCLRDMQENVNEVCAALKKEAKAEE